MRPTTVQSLNKKTGEPLQADAAREAATRCLTLLFSCAQTRAVLGRNISNPDQFTTLEALTQLVLDLMQHGGSLDADIQALSAMLGCELVAVSSQKGADA